jgi:hypothetical protein
LFEILAFVWLSIDGVPHVRSLKAKIRRNRMSHQLGNKRALVTGGSLTIHRGFTA